MDPATGRDRSGCHRGGAESGRGGGGGGGGRAGWWRAPAAGRRRSTGRPVDLVDDLPGAVAAREAAERPRWLWASGAAVYPALLRAGVRVERCHDVELTEALLLGHAGRWGEPRSLAAAYARLIGGRGPTRPAGPAARATRSRPGRALRGRPRPRRRSGIDALTRVYADQLARIAAAAHPGRFRLLVAAESAGALVAVEMGRAGLPWRADVHDELLARAAG